MYKYDINNIGQFTEIDNGKVFTYRETNNFWAHEYNLPFEVDVLDGTRFARITKTRCYIAVDEAADGSPVIETWKIRKHITY